MPITDEQIRKFKRYFDSRAKRFGCPFCGENDWQPENMVALPHLGRGESTSP